MDSIKVKWSNEGSNPGPVVEVEVEPGRLEWMSPVSADELEWRGGRISLEVLARRTWAYHAHRDAAEKAIMASAEILGTWPA